MRLLKAVPTGLQWSVEAGDSNTPQFPVIHVIVLKHVERPFAVSGTSGTCRACKRIVSTMKLPLTAATNSSTACAPTTAAPLRAHVIARHRPPTCALQSSTPRRTAKACRAVQPCASSSSAQHGMDVAELSVTADLIRRTTSADGQLAAALASAASAEGPADALIKVGLVRMVCCCGWFAPPQNPNTRAPHLTTTLVRSTPARARPPCPFTRAPVRQQAWVQQLMSRTPDCKLVFSARGSPAADKQHLSTGLSGDHLVRAAPRCWWWRPAVRAPALARFGQLLRGHVQRARQEAQAARTTSSSSSSTRISTTTTLHHAPAAAVGCRCRIMLACMCNMCVCRSSCRCCRTTCCRTCWCCTRQSGASSVCCAWVCPCAATQPSCMVRRRDCRVVGLCWWWCVCVLVGRENRFDVE